MNLDPDPWDRPSFDMNVRPDMAVRKVSRKDILLPKGPSKPRMFALTFVAMVSTVSVGAAWIWLTVGIAAVVFWLTLFTLAVRESAADRRYSEQLNLPG